MQHALDYARRFSSDARLVELCGRSTSLEDYKNVQRLAGMSGINHHDDAEVASA